MQSVEMDVENYLNQLLEKNKNDSSKVQKINQAKGVVSSIIALTSRPQQDDKDSERVTSLTNQLSTLLGQVDSNPVNVDGALALYRGLHWWISKADIDRLPKGKKTRQVEDARIGQSFVNIETTSNALRQILQTKGVEYESATRSQIIAAIAAIKNELRSLSDGVEFYSATGVKKPFADGFHYLLSRFVGNQRAFEERLEAGRMVRSLWTEVASMRSRLASLNKSQIRESFLLTKRIDAVDENIRRELSGVDSIYVERLNLLTKSPFISTSKSALNASNYALGSKFDRDGYVARKNGEVGKTLVYIFSLKDLQRLGALDIEKLRNQNKVVIGQSIQDMEITFTASIPGNYLRAQLAAQGGDSPSGLAARTEQRAAAEATRDGGIRSW